VGIVALFAGGIGVFGLLNMNGAQAVPVCAFDSAAHSITITDTDGNIVLSRDPSGTILVDGAPCVDTAPDPDVTATVANVDSIGVFGIDAGDDNLTVDLSNGRFEPGFTAEGSGVSEIEITADLGAGGNDTITVNGSNLADTYAVGESLGSRTFNFNGDSDSDDLIESGAEGATVNGNDGADTINASGLSTLGITLNGGNENDTLTGGAAGDTLNGGIGNDVLSGGAGVDTINGNEGNDTINGGDETGAGDVIDGGAQPDTINGGGGDDTINGGDGNDVLHGDAGDDSVNGDNGDDQVFGDADDDTVSGGNDNDTVSGGAGDDSVNGDNGNDTLNGDAGDDTLLGGFGDDVLDGGADDDVENGESGSDTYYQGTLPNGADVISTDSGTDVNSNVNDCCSGSDTVDYSGRTAPVNVTVADNPDPDGAGILGPTADDGQVGEMDDVRGDVEIIRTGSGIDSVTGDASGEAIYGDGGVDTLNGSDGNDDLYGGDANDTLNGGNQNDELYGEAGNDTLNGGANDDYLDGGVGNDTENGEAGNDTYYQGTGSNGADTLSGGTDTEYDRVDYSDRTAPVSVTVGSGANDGESGEGDNVGANVEEVDTGDGNDTITAGSNPLTANAGDGNDTLTGSPGNDTLEGGDGDDTINGLAGDDTLYGRECCGNSDDGDDTINGGDGNDELFGQVGNDNLNGDAGEDFVAGGPDDDALNGGADNDDLAGGPGEDVMNGGAGDDSEFGGGNGNDGEHDVFNQEAAPNGSDQIYMENDEVLDYSARTTSVNVDFDENGDDGAVGEADNVHFQNSFAVSQNSLIASDVSAQEVGDDCCSGVTILGGSAGDTLSGTYSEDHIVGNNGGDVLHGETNPENCCSFGNDFLVGGAGDDSLFGDTGDDMLDGGAGNDILDGDGDDVGVLFDGGEDTALYDTRTTPVVVTIDDVANDGETSVGEVDDVRTSVENVYGGLASDSLTGSDSGNFLKGNDGDDALNGGEGDDDLYGEAGNDTANGGDDQDDVRGGDGNDALDGQAGDDDVYGNGGNDNVNGGDDNDRLQGDGGYSLLTSSQEGGPAFDFLDISNTGQPAVSGDDECSGPVPLGFAFTFFGQTFNNVWVSSNGALVFGDPLNPGFEPDECDNFDLDPIPSGESPNNAIYAYNWDWDTDGQDCNTPVDGDEEFTGCIVRTQTIGSAPNRVFVTMWKNVPACCTEVNDGIGTFEVKIFESTGNVEVHYQFAFSDPDYGDNALAGIEAGEGGDAVQYFWSDGDDPLGVRGQSQTAVRYSTSSGNDILDGGLGDDTEAGGAGDDVFHQIGHSPNGADVVAGEAGTDTVDYSTRTAPVSVTLDNQPNDGEIDADGNGNSEGDNIINTTENIIGGTADDSLTGSNGPNVIFGGPGNDTIVGLGGDDTFFPGTGADTVRGGEGVDTVNDQPCTGGEDTISETENINRAACPSPAGPGPVTPAPGGGNAPNTGLGYRMVASDGGVFTFGDRTFEGSLGSAKLNKPIVGGATNPSTKSGYWMVASDGGVFTFGDAPFFGSTASSGSSDPIVEIEPTPTGKGYFLVDAKGRVFPFGDAATNIPDARSITLNKSIIGMSVTPSGQGYYLVASDGGIFTFGDAKFFGSTGNLKLNSPIIDLGVTPDGQGYFLLGGDGGIFTFGNADFKGSTGDIKLNKPAVAMLVAPTGAGYWIIASDGGVFTFGAVPFLGSMGCCPLNAPILDAIS
jgi:Ca2+-binding RTX toxin-like protein